jgi:catechol 2,3-dioxygenase-like lactoylglutathione lyase family enzyme
MIIGIDHVQITVPANAVAAARAFYCGLLGLREVEKPAALQGRGGFWLEVGDRQVHVGAEDGVRRHATRAHVAYAVTDVAAWRARLAAAGVEILDGIPIPGHDRFEFRDPFGNRVELIGASQATRRCATSHSGESPAPAEGAQ